MVEPKMEKIEALLEEGFDVLIIAGESNVQYFTGFRGAGATLIASKDGSVLLVPQLEYGRASSLVKVAEVRPYFRYPLQGIKLPGLIEGTWIEAILRVLGKHEGRIGADLSYLPYSAAKKLSEKIGDIIDVSEKISELRAVKDGDEIEAMEAAARAAEAGLRAAMDGLAEGMSETELAGEIDRAMRRAGAQDYAFPTIVAFSENTANPHAIPGGRRLQPNTPVLVDLGARVSGYCSDMTRTMTYGSSGKRFREIAEAVLEAQYAGIDAVAPGVAASDPDAAARRVLEKKGLASYFIHSLGHGVGIDVHEHPRLSPSSNTVLKPGMVVTVEPGVYIDGFAGVRIEDMVLVTKKGRRLLTRFERILF